MCRRRRRLLACICLGLLPSVLGSAAAALPHARASLDTQRVALGDPVRLRLELRYGAEHRLQPPDLAGWLGELATELPEPDPPVRRGDSTVVVYRATLQFFALGAAEVPSLSVAFATASGDTLWQSTEPLRVEVVGVREEGDEEPRDIHPPVKVPGGVPLWVVVAGSLLALGVLGGCGYYWWRRPGPAPPAPPAPPTDYAAEFLRIAALGHLDRGEVKEYYTLLADNLRRHLEQRLGVHALECTTDELVRELTATGLDAGTIAAVGEFLSTADLVKFAKLVPSLMAARRAPHLGVALVERVDRWLAQQRAAELEAAASPGEPAAASPHAQVARP